MFRDLRVVGLGGGEAVQHNLASPFSPQCLMNYINTLRHSQVRGVISGFEGVVLPGEMLRMYIPFSAFSLAYARKFPFTQLSWVVRVLDAVPF